MKKAKLLFPLLFLGFALPFGQPLFSRITKVAEEQKEAYQVKENTVANDEVFSNNTYSILGGRVHEANTGNNNINPLEKPKIGFQAAYSRDDDGNSFISIRFSAAIASLDVSAVWTRAMYDSDGEVYPALKEAQKESTVGYKTLNSNGKSKNAKDETNDLGENPYNYFVVYTLLDIPLASYGTYYLDASLTLTYFGESITSTVGSIEVNQEDFFSYERGTNDFLDFTQHMDEDGKPYYSVKGKSDKKDEEKNVVVPGYYSNGNHRYKVSEIEEEGFLDFLNICDVDLPDTLTKVGKDAFKNALRSCIYDRGDNGLHLGWHKDWNPDLRPFSFNYRGIVLPRDGVLYSICYDKGQRRIYSSAVGYIFDLVKDKDIIEVKDFYGIPTTEIGNYAFSVHASKKNRLAASEITMPSTIEKIGEGVFANTDIATCYMPDRVTEVPADTFLGCEKLSSVRFAPCTTKIGEYAFLLCKSLTSIQIPDSVEVIDTFAFGACYNLKHINIPTNCKRIESDVFYECLSLRGIFEIPADIEFVGDNVFPILPAVLIVFKGNDEFEVLEYVEIMYTPDGEEYEEEHYRLTDPIDYSAPAYEYPLMDIVRHSNDTVFTKDNITYSTDIFGTNMRADFYSGYLTSDCLTLPTSVEYEGTEYEITRISYGFICDCDNPEDLKTVVVPEEAYSMEIYDPFIGCYNLENIICLDGEIHNDWRSDNDQFFNIFMTEDEIDYPHELGKKEQLDSFFLFSEEEPSENPNGYWHFDENGNVTLWDGSLTVEIN